MPAVDPSMCAERLTSDPVGVDIIVASPAVRPSALVNGVDRAGFANRAVAANTSGTVVLKPVLHKSRSQALRISAQALSIQEAERKRIASDLHDGLGQALSALKFGVERALCSLDADAVGDAKTALKLLVPNINGALEEVRRLVMNLRPSLLDDLGILATLSWFVREFESLYPAIRVETELGIAEADVPDSLKLTLFRVVQEAMNNVAKHSHATSVKIGAEIAKSELRLSITDNGIGFDRAEVASRRGLSRTHGQLCLKERTESSGGRIAIETAIGKGVCVRMAWPCVAPVGRSLRESASSVEDDLRGDV